MSRSAIQGARKFVGLRMLGARRSEVLGFNGADEPANKFDPGHRFGITDYGPPRRGTRGRNCFFRRPDRRDLDQEAEQWKYFTRDAAD